MDKIVGSNIKLLVIFSQLNFLSIHKGMDRFNFIPCDKKKIFYFGAFPRDVFKGTSIVQVCQAITLHVDNKLKKMLTIS